MKVLTSLLFLSFLFCATTTLQAQSADDLIAEGVALLESGDHAGALAKLDAAIAADGSSGKAYFKRGKVKSAKQDDAGALADYNKAVELGFENGELYRLKGMSEHLTGAKDQSCADFDKAVGLGDPMAGALKDRFCK